jgi:hypothetical protein
MRKSQARAGRGGRLRSRPPDGDHLLVLNRTDDGDGWGEILPGAQGTLVHQNSILQSLQPQGSSGGFPEGRPSPLAPHPMPELLEHHGSCPHGSGEIGSAFLTSSRPPERLDRKSREGRSRKASRKEGSDGGNPANPVTFAELSLQGNPAEETVQFPAGTYNVEGCGTQFREEDFS